MDKQRYVVNEYENGWTIEYGLFGIWRVFKDGKCYGRFGIYSDAEKHLRRLQGVEDDES